MIGGGERYVTELARWMSRRVDTTLVSFSPERASRRDGDLAIEVYPARRLIHGSKLNPLSARFLTAFRGADVVHVHHIFTLVSDMACLAAAALRKRVFVTDYGGGASFSLSGRRLPVMRLYDRAVAYSQFGIECLPPALKSHAALAKGGIDLERFKPAPNAPRTNTILFVGRLLAHKGINYLIDVFRALGRADYTLRIIGRVHDPEFFTYLKERASGLRVEFVHDATDDRLLAEYQSARVTVLPSVHNTYKGHYTPVPELMGFTLLESQACGTPVVCSDAGAMPEFVDPGRTGFVVAQNSGDAIADALRKLVDASPDEYAQLRRNCESWVGPLNWAEVTGQYLKLYEDSLR